MMSNTTETASNLEHMLNLSSEQRTDIWREILTEADPNHRAIGAAIFAPFKDAVYRLMPQCNFHDDRSAHYGQQAIKRSMDNTQYQFENQLRGPDHENHEHSAGAIETAYQHACAITAQYVELLNDKTETEARWALAKHGALDTYLKRYDEFEDDSAHNYWRRKPENFATITFTNEFPHEQTKLFNALFYPDPYAEFPTDGWDKTADTKLVVRLYHSAMQQFPSLHVIDQDDNFDLPDNNRLRFILTYTITSMFSHEYHNVISLFHKDEYSAPFPDSIILEFNPPEYQQIQRLIIGYFNAHVDIIDDDIRAALDSNDHTALTATIDQLTKLEQEVVAMNDCSKTNFPPMDSAEQRADLNALLDQYREQLLEAMFNTAHEHVTPDRDFFAAMSMIDIQPISPIDNKIQSDWIQANDPKANPAQDSTHHTQQ